MDVEPVSQRGPGSFSSSEASLGHPRLLLLREDAGGEERPCSVTRLLRSGGFTEGHPVFCGVEAGIGLHEQHETLSSGAGAWGRCWLRRAGQIPLRLPACL